MKKKYINATVEMTSIDINDVITASLTYIDGDNQGAGVVEDGNSFSNLF